MSVEADRARLVSRDPLAMLIDAYVASEQEDSLEVICPEPGTVLPGGVRFLDGENVTPEKLHSRLYTMAVRGHWMKTDVWVQKKGRSVWLHKHDYKEVTR